MVTFDRMEQNKFVLVTGGAGYIGSHTVVELIDANYTPIILDDFRNSSQSVLARLEKIIGTSLITYNGSCENKELLREIFTQHKIEGIIHFAADKAVGESVLNPLKYYENNITGLVSILSVMNEFDVNHFVFSSSCTVYGIPDSAIVDENTPLNPPNSPYGFTKLWGETILKHTAEAYPNLKISLLRYFNPIGAHSSGEIGEAPQGIPNNLLPYLTQTASGERDSLTVYGNDYTTDDGTCIRDYVHVSDVASAHVAAINHIEKSSNSGVEVFNIGTGKGTSVLEIINIFEKVTGLKLNWSFGKRREGDVPEIFASIKKAQNELNWQPKHSVEDAVSSAWKWEENRKKHA